MVRGIRKKRAHPETSTHPVVTSTPLGTSAHLITTSTPPRTFASPTTTFTPSATLTPLLQLPYSSLAPISTHSSSTFATETLSRPASLSSASPPAQGVVDARVLITPASNSFNKQSDCAKVISEIMKEHFVEAHGSFGKVPDNIKNMWFTEFGKRYRWDPIYEGPIRDAWKRRASLRYKDLMYEVRADGFQPEWMTTTQYTSLCNHWNSDAYKKKRETAQKNRLHGRGGQGPGKHTGGSRSFIEWREKMGEAFAQSELYVLLHQQKGQWIDTRSDEFWAKFQQLKANAEHLHIETGSPIPSDEQLMFEAAGGSNKGHVYGFGSQSGAITAERREGSSSLSVPSVSSTAGHDACIEREKKLLGYMQQAQERFADFMHSFASQCGVQLDSVPALFPPFSLTHDATSDVARVDPQPPTSPPSSCGSLLSV